MNEVEGHYSFWQYRKLEIGSQKKKKKKGGGAVGKGKKKRVNILRLYGQFIRQWMAKF